MNPWVLFGLLIVAVIVVWAWMALMEHLSPSDSDEFTGWWTYDEATGKWHRDQDR